LNIIASSPTKLQAVFEGIAEKVTTICGAEDAVIRLVEGDFLRLVAYRGNMPLGAELISLRPESALGQAIFECRTIHLDDFESTIDEIESERLRALGNRTLLLVPLKHAGVAIGVII